MYVFFLKWVSCCRKESVVLRLGGQRRGEKNSLSVQSFTLLQPPSVPNVTSAQSLWFSFMENKPFFYRKSRVWDPQLFLPFINTSKPSLCFQTPHHLLSQHLVPQFLRLAKVLWAIATSLWGMPLLPPGT